MKKTSRPRIVNCDDNEIGRYAVTKMLQRAGFDVIEAATGSEALSLANEQPDLILLDVNLPDLSGFEVCRRLKSHTATKLIPILHLSATYNDPNSKVIALEGGADGYLTQPVEPPVLIAHINALLRSSTLEKQLAKINRSLKAVLQCNQALLQSQSESNVLREVCRILVEVTGYRFVSIDRFDQTTGTILKPLAQWGMDDGFHELANMSVGQRSLAALLEHSFRAGGPLAVPDVSADPRCEAWRREALDRSIVSALFLPLRPESNLWGVITILSDIPAFSDDEELAPLHGFAYDLSYRIESFRAKEQVVEAQETLKRSEEKYRLLFEKSKDGVVIHDAESMKFLDVNPSFRSMLGYWLSELMTMTPIDISLEPESTQKALEEAAKPGGTHVPLRLLKRKDGSPISVEISASQPFEWHNRRLICSIVRDVTDRVRAEREREELRSQLLQSQKMEAVGTLAAGIAHDFNNMLQVILGYAEMLLGEKTEVDPGHAELQKIINKACEARDLVQKIRIFTRKADIAPVPVDLNHQLAELTKLLSHTLLKSVDMELRFDGDVGLIRADPALIDQMVTNLVINADEAMPDGGTLTLETRNTVLDDQFCKSHVGVKPGPYVALVISDTGKGMSTELMERIFDPFFSTKQRDYHRGTGLGLSVVKGIVDEHGAHVTVESELGRWSTFTIYFPTLETQEIPKREPKNGLPWTGGETVLLVEDEDFVRELGIRLLERFGYNVIAACDGQEALELYSKEQHRISLVILDIVMPRMNGKECLQELLKINPAVKVIISSGVAQGDRIKEVVDMGAKGSLLKPYGIKTLREKIREVINGE